MGQMTSTDWTGSWGGVLACVVLVVGCIWLGWGASGPGAVWLTYGALFLPYLWICLIREELGAGSLPWVAGTALVARGVLIPAEPVLSDDIYRYVWDGRVAEAGINPFVHAPEADALAHLRDGAIWPAINHADVPTIYPPVAQFVFEWNAHLGGAVGGLKFWFVGIEVAAVAVCVWWCRRRGVSWESIVPAVAVYGLNPLVVVEVAHSGHVDVVAWSLLAVALVVWWEAPEGEQQRRGCGVLVGVAVLLGLSAGTKFLSLAVLPFLVAGTDWLSIGGAERWRRLWRRGAMCVGVVVVVATSYAPYVSAGGQLFDGFGRFASVWRSNDGGFRAVRTGATEAMRSAVNCRDSGTTEFDGRLRCDNGELLITLEGLDPLFERMGWTKTWQGERLPDTTWTAVGLGETMAKGVAVFVVLSVMSAALAVGASPAGGLLAVLVALYLFAPVVHPWYVGWLVPLTVLAGRRVGVVFSAAVLAGYAAWWSAQVGGAWRVPTWLVGVEYSVVAVAVWWEVVERR